MDLRQRIVFSIPLASSHSHRTLTVHPLDCRASILTLSRLTFRSILASQYATLLDGILEFLHPCQCQRHPLTNTATPYRGNTISGFPGNFRSCSLNRKPAAWMACRALISGLVFLERTRAMTRLRWVCEIVSAIFLPTRLDNVNPVFRIADVGQDCVRVYNRDVAHNGKMSRRTWHHASYSELAATWLPCE